METTHGAFLEGSTSMESCHRPSTTTRRATVWISTSGTYIHCITTKEAAVGYAHEQNGLLERHIRTVFERVLAVLSDTKLPKKLWTEILQTVIYVKNRSPVRPLGSKTPYEVLYGKKPDLSNLRIPGYIAYAIIPKEKRGKSDFHASRARYLGPEASNQHRLYEEDSGRVISSQRFPLSHCSGNRLRNPFRLMLVDLKAPVLSSPG